MSSPSYDADVLIVGAGPAGVSAAVMAASLKLRTVVIEAGLTGGKLHVVGALSNMPGNWSTGPDLAQALAQDLQRLQEDGWCTLMQARAVAVNGHDDRAELTLDSGQVLTGQAIVVATGVATLTPAEADWVTAPSDLAAPPLWRAAPDSLMGRTYVLGADRPIGTWLRVHQKTSNTLHVLCPPTDEYKVAEVAGDDRVRIVPVSHVTITRPAYGDGWTVEVKDQDGERTVYAVTTVLNNMGNRPAALKGLAQGEDGYCPTDGQHPRIQVAGDLRSSRYQRIATAQGSGAEAVLTYYYGTTSPGSGGPR
ncbi:NAD(P)/FAD-dependent oxidoreductase [Streptomyces xinghaiensis]|uniref:NAD(P)/FAD-dependent oxidoreductase n=2 Tax=Streptomyces TaxID=1883 RepID=A0A3R7EMM8_9ACTN|nr:MULTISPECIES: NAD(P)/FAD-dependent oxidoreductase [Streptomyces]KNE83369.1 oxidoreductase [Streptomyces fradiae]OFA34143.1 oxidoreductase [Streptomyces fradiae]PQM20542.1 NAD(P)/FAD-dependent oxidoreductase [Streptomyces xinghaiensis]RKM92484.1 NAD(P)/FAD-dependent oxidoreductase [Streptomyces xinghaiensis]RNC70451.1 NAD(P)/FAD-dependent oxidoreductase [Streptomyces xinghaiensis]